MSDGLKLHHISTGGRTCSGVGHNGTTCVHISDHF